MITNEYKLSMTPQFKQPVVWVSQYDTGARVLKFNLFANGAPLTIPSGATAVINGVKTDGTAFSYSMTVGDTYVQIEVQEQMTAVAGAVTAEVVLTDTDGNIGTANFTMMVERSPLDEGVISESEISVIQEAVEDAQQAAQQAQTVLDSIPADYSELSDDVTDLKSALKYSKVNPYNLTDEEAGYFTTSGNISNQSGTNLEVYTKNYIPIDRSLGFIFRWWLLNEGSAWIRICFYTTDKTFISAYSPSIVNDGVDDGYTLYHANVSGSSIPNTAVYCRISYRTFGEHKAQICVGVISNYGISQTDINYYLSVAGKPTYAFDHIGVKAIAHRGLIEDNEYPENTLPAFRNAVDKGFDFIEVDLRFTSDDVPVILHDASINRTARNADGTEISGTINIADITYAQALQYDFGIWRGAQFAGTKIPTLEEVLYFCRDTGTYPYIDCALTSSAAPKLKEVARLVTNLGLDRMVTFISSNELVLQAYLIINPTFRCGYLLNGDIVSNTEKFIALIDSVYNRVFIDCSLTAFNSYSTNIINYCKAHNYELELWTVDSLSAFSTMPDIISGVTSNNHNYKQIRKNKALNT